MKTSLEKLLLSSSSSIRDALNLINNNGLSACFIIEGNSKIMVGIVTDGDIRRAILGGIELDNNIMNIANRHYYYANINDTPEKINFLLSEKIKILPLLNENKKPVDYATISHLRYLPIYEPYLQGNELSYVNECVKTGWI